MKILYGGSFNPPTIAHYEIAKFIIKKFPDADFEFLPSNNFYKENNQRDFKYRCDMLSLICERLGNVPKVNGFELSLDKYYGTSFTMKHFPHAYFLMGADNLESIDTWIDYPNVVITNKFIIMPRGGKNIDEIFKANELLAKHQNNFTIIKDFSALYISSTLYRNSLNDRYLTTEVAKYIKENNLYKE